MLDRLVPTAQVVVPPSGKVEPVDWVSGASFMVSREALEAVGLLDEQFFLYFEETDFMARLSDAGFRVMHVPSSRVVHLAGQATGYRASDVPRRLSPHWLQSRAHFFVKHHGRLGLVLATVLFLSGDMFRRVRHALGLRPKTSPPHLWRDYLRFGFSSEGGVGHGPAVR